VAQHRTLGRPYSAISEVAPGDYDWLSAVWDTSPDAMALSDPEGIVIAVNPAYCELYGFPGEKLVGNRFSVIFPREKRALADQQYRQVFQSEETPPSFEAGIERANGEQRTVESRVSFLVHNDRRVAMLSIIRDVTEQQAAVAAAVQLAAENALLYKQATETLRRREEFVAMASHELKNPLAALRACAELLKRKGEYLPNMVDNMIVQTTRLDRVIRNMLDFSLGESGHLMLRRGSVDLVHFLQQAVSEAQMLTRQHEVRLEAPDRPLVGDWDKDRLDQVIQNLLSNAVKYSPNGGAITVRAEDLGTAARISVADQGVGISEESLAQLFTRFYRSPEAVDSKAGGLGLGLSIARMLVQAHGGSIDVRSRLGEGSTFSVTLPYESTDGTPTEEPWTG